MLNFGDLAYVTNGVLISLQNLKNKQYLSFDWNTNNFKVNGIHPFLINKDFEKDNNIFTEFYIYLASAPNQIKLTLSYGSQVCLLTKEGMCFTCTNNGEIKIEALKGDKTLNSYNLPQNSKFTLIDPYNQNNLSKPLLFNDEVILRSPFGNYFMLNSYDLTINSNGMIISEDSIWKMIKSTAPYLPDWTFKRKHLNFNCISYLYNLEKAFDLKKSQNNPMQSDKLSLLTLSPEHQEKCLLEDLLLILIGLEGNYIKRTNKKKEEMMNDNSNIYKNFILKFEVEPYLDNPTCAPSLLYMVQKILPLSVYFDRVTSFINLNSHIETGLISKSFTKALRKVVREYLLFINQLEEEYKKENLDLQKLWYLAQPSLKVFENLQKLCYQASLVKGGALLNIIYSFLQNTTDLELKKLFKFLLNKSIEPYYEILKKWTCRGFLDDKFDEFMILANSNFNKENLGEYYYDLFWDKKFILNKDNIPEFFSSISEKVFFIGKSLNILRECEKIIECPYEEEFQNFVSFSSKYIKYNNEKEDFNNFNIPKDSMTKSHSSEKQNESIFNAEILVQFQNLISKIFQWTNKTIRQVLFKENNLEGIFKSVKKFFFMECGDFFTHLIDLGDEMLLMEKNKVNFDKFEVQIENALRSTSANLDPNKDLFSFQLSNMIIRTEKLYLDKFNEILKTNEIKSIITGIKNLNEDKSFFDFEDSKILESLLLEMKVTWPLNLIFSKKSLIKYKIIFRQLIILKFEEKKLSETWILQQNFKEYNLQNYLKPSYLLRDKMINFVKNIIYYFFNEVVEPNYLEFINKLLGASSLDEIIVHHDLFLDTLLKECLLEETDILIQINDILQACLIYSKIIIKFYNSAILDEKLVTYQSDQNKMFISPQEKKREKMKQQSLALNEIFLGEDKKFLMTVEKFRQHFENKLEIFLDKINRL